LIRRNLKYKSLLLLNYIFDSKPSYLPLEIEHFNKGIMKGNNLISNNLLAVFKEIKEKIWVRYIFFSLSRKVKSKSKSEIL
jgi:hypothetical protein